jgi:hypothetical protein
MKSPRGLIAQMDNVLSELENLEVENEFKNEMKSHINSMAVLTLLKYGSKGKKVGQVLEKSK